MNTSSFAQVVKECASCDAFDAGSRDTVGPEKSCAATATAAAAAAAAASTTAAASAAACSASAAADPTYLNSTATKLKAREALLDAAAANRAANFAEEKRVDEERVRNGRVLNKAYAKTKDEIRDVSARPGVKLFLKTLSGNIDKECVEELKRKRPNQAEIERVAEEIGWRPQRPPRQPITLMEQSRRECQQFDIVSI